MVVSEGRPKPVTTTMEFSKFFRLSPCVFVLFIWSFSDWRYFSYIQNYKEILTWQSDIRIKIIKNPLNPLDKTIPPTTTRIVGGIWEGFRLHVEAAVEVFASTFGSPGIESLLGCQSRMSGSELWPGFSIVARD